MKRFYIIALVIGVWLLVASQVYTFAYPRDVLMAGLLMKNPEAWNVTLNATPEMSNVINDANAKKAILEALRSPREFDSAVRLQYLQAGAIITAFSIMGLLRERRLRKETKASNQAFQVIGDPGSPQPER
jgi:hypothetical protein